MRRESFTADRPLRFELATGSGDVEILPSGTSEVVVELDGGPEATYFVEFTGAELIVRPPAKRSGKRRFASTDIKIFAPEGVGGEVRTASGDVVVMAELSHLSVATASGDVRVSGSVQGDFEAKSASGDLKLHNVGRNVFAATASGDVLVGDVGGDLRFNSASGDLHAGAVDGVVEIKSVSADATIAAVAGHTVRARTLSGDVRLGIPPGRKVDLEMQTLSGEVINRLATSPDSVGRRKPLVISIKTVSGDLKLENA